MTLSEREPPRTWGERARVAFWFFLAVTPVRHILADPTLLTITTVRGW